MSGYFGYNILFSYLKREHYSVHVHHWIIGISIIIFMGYLNSYVTAVHAIFNGMYIEGSARWGNNGWIWSKRATPKTTTSLTSSQLKAE
jgi:hypothetical protein